MSFATAHVRGKHSLWPTRRFGAWEVIRCGTLGLSARHALAPLDPQRAITQIVFPDLVEVARCPPREAPVPQTLPRFVVLVVCLIAAVLGDKEWDIFWLKRTRVLNLDREHVGVTPILWDRLA